LNRFGKDLHEMPTRIALLRGINVGGKNVLPMTELVRDLQALALRDVTTYIQSGNVVFSAAGETATELGDRIAAGIENRHGFRPHVLILTPGQLQLAIESNPFGDAESDPKTLHLFFLASAPTAAGFAGLEAAKSASERFQLVGQVLYLHAPDGIGRSKLAANAEKLLGVTTTSRNWRTVKRLSAMVRGD
jgi:uncharacterized protein (DUF1697 family)